MSVDMSTLHLPEPNERQTRWSLFLGILIWFLHFNILNALTSTACKWSLLSARVGSITGLQFVEAFISLVSLLLVFFLLFLPWRVWRSAQSTKPVTNPELLQQTEESRPPFLAFVAMLLNGFFFLFILASFVPIFALHACGQA
jgi:hypothetical protein